MEKQLVIFDLDGTLYKTETSFIPAISQLLTEYGIPHPNEDFLFSLIGEPLVRFSEWFEKLGFKDDSATIVRKMNLLEIKYIKERGCIYPNVLETLKWLKNKTIKMALCSNGSQMYISQILDKFGLYKYFEIVRWHKNNQETKSDVTREIIEALNPQKTFIVGDRYHDIVSAKDNNCISIGVSYGYGKSEIKKADYIIDDIWMLKDIITKK